MATQRPRALFFGGGGGTGRIMLVDSGTEDGFQPFFMRAMSNPIAPAAPSQELIVYATYLHITITETDLPLYLFVRLYIDDLDPLIRLITLPPSAGQGERHWEREVSWHHTVNDAVTVAPRGFRMSLELEIAGSTPAGRIVIDGVETEVEIAQETLKSDVS